MELIELEILFQILHLSHADHYERSSLHETYMSAQQKTHLLTPIDSNPGNGRFHLQVRVQVQEGITFPHRFTHISLAIYVHLQILRRFHTTSLAGVGTYVNSLTILSFIP